MELQLDEKFKVTTDSSSQNFQLEKLEDVKDKKSGEIKQEWKLIGYFGNNFESLLIRYMNESLLNMGETNVAEVVAKIHEVKTTISRVVKRENIRLEVKEND